ncbi:hypothetical protein B0H14DRAFT_2594395 [Mycena olivaceomarginata]|nr:hypothetical protein B0H14DRAFT_2594395 [Mycena olivaceomarginata]
MSYYQRSSGSNGDNSRQRGGHSRVEQRAALGTASRICAFHWFVEPRWLLSRCGRWLSSNPADFALRSAVSSASGLSVRLRRSGIHELCQYADDYYRLAGFTQCRPPIIVQPERRATLDAVATAILQPHPRLKLRATTSSYPRSHTPGGSSSRNNHSRQPSATQIHLPDPEPHPGIMSGADGGKVCSHCHATRRLSGGRDPRTHKPLCNACGAVRAAAWRPRAGGGDSDEDGEYDGRECGNCGTRRTSAWRREQEGRAGVEALEEWSEKEVYRKIGKEVGGSYPAAVPGDSEFVRYALCFYGCRRLRNLPNYPPLCDRRNEVCSRRSRASWMEHQSLSLPILVADAISNSAAVNARARSVDTWRLEFGDG